MSQLVTYVHVNGVAYGPDSDVPKSVAVLITNPDAWDVPPTASEPVKQVATRRRTSSAGD